MREELMLKLQEKFKKQELVGVENAINELYKFNNPEYIDENMQVSTILVNLGLSLDIIITSLLKNIDYDKNKFDDDILELVDSANAVNNFAVTNTIDNDYEDYRNMLVIMARDYRVIIIELAERLYKMRSFKKTNELGIKKYAKETQNIYAPIAHRLGLGEIKSELEELSLYFLDLVEFKKIVKFLELKKTERNLLVDEMIKELDDLIKDQVSDVNIFGRSKSISSIYHKTIQKGKNIEDIFDLQGIRIICNTKIECYTILGIIHNKYSPIPGRFKDYIAIKKPNLYQSLHTSVIGIDHKPFEIQIRTKEMDTIAERGIAAHWIYKEDNNKSLVDVEEQLHLFRDVITTTGVVDEQELDKLQENIFESSIYTFTPNGKIIQLPKKATVIDFAYRIHSKLATEMIGAVVNGNITPYYRQLENGDIVEIKSKKGAKSPNSEWLNNAVTAHAKRKIRAYLKTKQDEINKEDIQKGKDILLGAIKRKEVLDFIDDERNKLKVMKAFGCSRISDFYVELANKKISIAEINDIFEPKQETFKMVTEISSENTTETVVVKGAEGIKKQLANCCSPIYGDEIVGIIINGVGIKIHRVECKNIIDNDNKLNALWNMNISTKNKYAVDIEIFSEDRDSLLGDFIALFSKNNIAVQNISSKVVGDTVRTKVTMIVSDYDHLYKTIENLKKTRNVLKVERIMH